jgi:hypothetical protein
MYFITVTFFSEYKGTHAREIKKEFDIISNIPPVEQILLEFVVVDGVNENLDTEVS